MTQQNSGSFRTSVSQGVYDAIMQAGQAHPCGGDTHIDVIEVIEALSDSMATFLGAGAMAIEDRKQRAAMLKDVSNRIVSRLDYLAERILDGTLRPPQDDRPKLRLVE